MRNLISALLLSCSGVVFSTPLAAQQCVEQTDARPKLVEYHVSWRNPLRLKELDAEVVKITVGGGGSVDISGLRTDKIVVKAAGGSNVKLAGVAEVAQLQVSGGGRLSAYGLEASNLKTQVSGGARAFVLANGEFNAQVSGAATLKYRGTPSKLRKHVSGSAKLLRDVPAPSRNADQQRRLDSLQRKLDMRMTVDIQETVAQAH